MSMLPPNVTTVRTSSDGAWQGDNPLNHAFPLLIVQTVLVLFLSRFLAFLLKPLRQPKVIAEILGGILLGPSALGRVDSFLNLVFPAWSIPVLESVASIGLLFYLFLVGLELDLGSIRRSGKKAFGIAFAGICLPFLFGMGATFILRKLVHGEDKVGYSQFLMFMGVALSITAFPVLARILAELKLLTTRVGETAMAAAAFNDVAAWIMLALAVALAGGGSGCPKSPLISLWILISGMAYVGFMFVVIRPMMSWMARQCSPEYDVMDEAYICITLAGVMLSGFMTDLIGIHAIFGAFVFGLTIPKGGVFATRLIKRIEDFVSGLLLPLYFASSGLKTNIAKIQGAEAWGLSVLVISMACTGKILGTFVVAMVCMIPIRESLALGVLMNTRGLVELIVLNIGKEKKVLNDEVFAILVLMAIFTTFMTTPTVMAIYKPRQIIPPLVIRRLRRQPHLSEDELRVLACVHGPGNIPSLMKLVEFTRTSLSPPLRLHVVRLVKLTSRPSSIIMVRRARKNGLPLVSRFCHGAMHDQVAVALQAYSQASRLTIHHSTAISVLSTMHEDINHVAQEKRAEMIILPFHKQWRGENEEEEESVSYEWREVNRKVLESAPCTVAVLLDRGLGDKFKQCEEQEVTVERRICIVFFGGPDDREALALVRRMANNSTVKVSIIRFMDEAGKDLVSVTSSSSPNLFKGRRCIPAEPGVDEIEQEMDEAGVEEFRTYQGSANYSAKAVNNHLMEALTAIGRSREYDLVVVGKGKFPWWMEAKLAGHEIEHDELGIIGSIFARSDEGIISSILVVQQQRAVQSNEAPEKNCKIINGANEESCA
ncbi:cation/H(+) antiporter 20-like isoform X2 [Rhodamnia argentea]|uniref:Cation/H(+) antiporter 20-like isoform X2 n=1 Tax=Rhodamnia argentea TaxID=178133 RepID=A0ABM3HLU7_9MYRT|nr:cation/H(+) antiporter 20-like isoform X2 [Rhodamnia argentea]